MSLFKAFDRRYTSKKGLIKKFVYGIIFNQCFDVSYIIDMIGGGNGADVVNLLKEEHNFRIFAVW